MTHYRLKKLNDSNEADELNASNDAPSFSGAARFRPRTARESFGDFRMIALENAHEVFSGSAVAGSFPDIIRIGTNHRMTGAICQRFY
jgi:hypothetical protein